MYRGKIARDRWAGGLTKPGLRGRFQAKPCDETIKVLGKNDGS